jgi:hypothetical protein
VPVGQRLTNLLRGTKAHEPRLAAAPPDAWVDEGQWPVDEEVLPRFPFVRHGYDCTAVETHIAELERELDEGDQELAVLRTQSASRDEVASEIKRIGEQTSAVLIAANEQRTEILRVAQEEADRRVAEATARATLITAEAEARLRELYSHQEVAQHERDRLLEDVRRVSVALAALADSSQPTVQTGPIDAPSPDS